MTTSRHSHDRQDRLPRHAQPARHALPDARGPAQARAGLGQGMGRPGPVQEAARRALRPREVRAARRPALCQRPDPHGPRGQQDPEGHDRQGAPAQGPGRRLHPGLGLPRPADRERDREEARPQPAARRDAGQEPRLRHRADRHPDGRLQAPGRAGRLGPSLSHHGLRQRGRGDPRLQARDRARLRLPRPQARVLVLRLRLVAGRIRDRVRRQEVADAGCGLQGATSRPRCWRRSACPPASLGQGPIFAVIWTTTAWTIPANQALNLNPELDYALVDTERGLLVLAASLVGKCMERYELTGTGAGHRQGREAGRPELPASAVRRGPGLPPPLAGVPGRLRHRRGRHRHRPLLAGLRPGRLQLLRRARPGLRRHPEPGAGQRLLRARLPAVRRPEHLEGGAAHHRGAGASRTACSPPRTSPTATRTAGATRRR